MRTLLVPLVVGLVGCGDPQAASPPDLATPPDLLPARPVLSFDEGRTVLGAIKQARAAYPVVQQVAAGDLDGDGKIDLALPNTDGVSLAVALGDGALGWKALPAIPTKGRPTALVALDLDGDGLDELVAGYDGNKLTTLHGRKNRIFDAPVDLDWIDNTHVLATGDLDGDGKPDVVCGPLSGSGLTFGLGDGRGGLAPRAAFAFPGPAVLVTTGDLDGDRKDDVALSEGFQLLHLLRSSGEGLAELRQIEVPGATVDAAAIADFNEDGRPDVLVTPSTGAGRLLLGAPGGAFTELPTLELPGHAPSVRVGDLDGDHHLDVVMARDQENAVIVLLGDGQGHFAKAPAALPTDGAAMGLALRDLDGDGRLDIAVAQGAGGVRVYRNTSR